MNNQEPDYAAPQTRSGDQRPINTDPREQPGLVLPANNTDPREQPGWKGPPPIAVMQPPRRGRSPWFWFGVSALILVIIFGGLATTALLLARTNTETRHFTVGSQPTLLLTNSNGDVHLVSGPAGEITVVAHKHTFAGGEDQIRVDYTQSSDGNTLTVTSRESSGVTLGLWRLGVDFEVTVPSQTTLNVQNSNGSVDASGIHGQITLNSSNGSIQADNTSGTLRLKTENGSITVSGASASGNSTFETSNGSISFSGSLDRSGTYLFHNSNGSIDLTLPADANFQVSSSTSNGSIASDFGATSGTVGTAPYAQVTLETSNGSISIHRAG